MPEHVTTKTNRVLPQSAREVDEDIEPNQDLLRQSNEG